MLIKKIKIFHLSKSKNFDLLNCKNGYKVIRNKKKTNYDWDDIIYINDFDANSLEIIKRESRMGANIYYIGYALEPDYDYNTTNPLYLVINRLIGYIEKIEGSSDKYLVIADSVHNKNINSVIDTI